MTFTPKTFTSGTALPALDLTHMDANDDHVREEASYYPIVTVQGIPLADIDDDYDTENYKVMIDTTRPSQTALTTSGTVQNISISSVSTGLHSISIWIYEDSHETTGEICLGEFAFYKSPDMDYLTWKLDKDYGYSNGSTFVEVYHVTILGHRETL